MIFVQYLVWNTGKTLTCFDPYPEPLIYEYPRHTYPSDCVSYLSFWLGEAAEEID